MSNWCSNINCNAFFVSKPQILKTVITGNVWQTVKRTDIKIRREKELILNHTSVHHEFSIMASIYHHTIYPFGIAQHTALTKANILKQVKSLIRFPAQFWRKYETKKFIIALTLSIFDVISSHYLKLTFPGTAPKCGI